MTAAATPLRGGRGGHALSSAQVRESQRERLVAATIAACAQRGYAAMTVADVTSRARVARRVFYAELGDKPAAFAAALDAIVQRLTAEMVAAVTPDSAFLEGVDAMATAYLTRLAAEPDVARVLLIATLEAGPEGLAKRAELHAAFAATFRGLYARARRADPSLPAVPAITFAAANGGFDEVLTEWARQERFADLPKLAGLARYLASALVAGHPTAAAELDPSVGRELT